MLHDITVRASPQRALGIDGFLVHGKHQNAQGGIPRMQIFQQFDPVLVGQRDIQKHKIRDTLRHDFERLFGATGLGGHIQIGRRPNQINDPLTNGDDRRQSILYG